MKKPILVKSAVALLAAVLAFGAVSCGDEELVINMETREVTIPAEGGEATFPVDVPSAWNLTVVDDWLSAEPDKGNPGKYEVTVSAEANTTGQVRIGTVRVNAVNADPVDVKVTQGTLNLSVSPASMNFPAEGGESSIDIRSNAWFTAEVTADWINLDYDDKMKGNLIMMLFVDENTTTRKREGKIILSYGVTGRAEVLITQDAAGEPVNIKAEAEDFTFAEGCLAGLFSGAPMNFSNEMLTWSDGKFAAEKVLRFAAEQTAKTLFFAYYPYDPELKATSFPFSVKTDQRELADYASGDLLLAAAEAAPSDGEVRLQFAHKMARLELTLDNKSGEMIKDVIISGIAPGTTVDLATASVGTAEGSAEGLYFRPNMAAGEGFSSVASLLFPPQRSEELKVVVILDSGKTFYFSCTGGQFVSGTQYAQTLVIENPEFAQEEFGFVLYAGEWAEGDPLRFSNGQIGVRSGWRLAYFPLDAEDGSWIVMEETAPGVFLAEIPDYREGDCFQLASENNTRLYFGCDLMIPQKLGVYDNCWPISMGGRWELSGYNGALRVWFYSDEGLLKYEPVN